MSGANKECPCKDYIEIFRLLMEYLDQKHEVDLKTERQLNLPRSAEANETGLKPSRETEPPHP